MLGNVVLRARTAAYLTPRQWVYWPLRRALVSKPVVFSGGGAHVAIERFERLAQTLGGISLRDASAVHENAARVVEGRFRFLNSERSLPEIDWRRAYGTPLWDYNLRYFDYAVDLALAYRQTRDERFLGRLQELCGGWMESVGNPPGRPLAPYPLSLRALNWIRVILILGDALPEAFRRALLESVHGQLRWLERNLEYHLLANHLQKNLQALSVGGLLFSGEDARRWRQSLAPKLWAQLLEQILPDGSHVERSPMYHAAFLVDGLETVALFDSVDEPVPGAVQERLARMAEALRLFTREGGELHLFNDSANGVAPAPESILALAERVLDEAFEAPTGLFELRDGGFYGWTDTHRGDRLIIDGGEPGPRYQPGHAHCGILSFELDLAGRPVVVDAGVHGYAEDPYREYVRSTRAHNTVAIDGREQSEIWGAFRMARRARVVEADAEAAGGAFRFRGAYRPYHGRRVLHSRTMVLQDGVLEVTDRVGGAVAKPLTSYLHFHPDQVVDARDTHYVARGPGVDVRLEVFGVDAVNVLQGETNPVQGWYCPEFGRAFPAPVLEMGVESNDGRAFGYRIRQEPP